jgi:toxin ParE1/3/4
MKVRFLSTASREFTEAVEYYNEQSSGLGYEFHVEVQAAIRRVKQFPEAWPKVSARARRCKVRRFPFGIAYEQRKEEIIVLAVVDLRRDLRHWQDRI